MTEELTTIGVSAFESCTSLRSLSFPSNLTRIDDRAFKDCTSLESVYITKKVDFIGSEAFSGCSKITEFTVENDSTSFSSIEGVLYQNNVLRFFPLGAQMKYNNVPSNTIGI